MRLAFVSEPLTRFGGAEHVLKTLHSMYPEAPIFTPYTDPGVISRFFPDADIRTSFLQKLRVVLGPRVLMPFLPLAYESFDLRDYDTVVSSSSAFAKAVVTRSHARHIAYIHTPARFLWEDRHLYFNALNIPRALKLALVPYFHWLRTWDQHTAHRPDQLFANSQYTAQRIKKYWQKNAPVLYPPVDTRVFGADHARIRRMFHLEKAYFLIVARLTPHKRIEIAQEAFQRLPAFDLVIVGEGPEKGRLQNRAPQNVRYLPWQGTETVRRLMAGAEAYLMPHVEDFGIAAVEAMAEGTPVLAFKGGGALETVKESETGLFFDDLDAFSLADCVRRMRGQQFDKKLIREHAQQFSESRFKDNIQQMLGI